MRTHLQSEWANTYEPLADWLGREIRYSDLPQEPDLAAVVTDLQDLSTGIGVMLEESRRDLTQGVRDVASTRSQFETAVQQPSQLTVIKRLVLWRHVRRIRRKISLAESTVNRNTLRSRALEDAYTQRLRDLQEKFVAVRDRGAGSWPVS